MIWDQLTSKQIEQVDKNTPVIVALAATEQHGSHLPLATDRLIGEHFCQTLHQSMPGKILVLPPIAIGCSSHHMDFPGTLSLSHQTFDNQVREIIASVLHHGFKKIILLISHGGNQGIGQVIIEKLGYDYPTCHFVLATWWHIVNEKLRAITKSGSGGTGHAGEFETSLLLHFAPEFVQTSEIKKGENQDTFPWANGDMLHGPRAGYYRRVNEMTPNGVFGNPLLGSAQQGEKITTLVNNALVEIVNDIFEHRKP